MSDLTGEIIDDRYQLLKVVAAGGMATIYSAMDLRLDRQVAVKIMHSHLASNEDFVNRFIREAKAAAALSHPNIVAIQDQGWNIGGAPAIFIVMELIEGFTLRDLLNEQGALSVTEALRYIAPVLSAMAAAHKKGILHRDIKPENILISKDGRVKVADFGLARGADIGSTLTAESSVILGSVSYLSPEQVQRGISDARSDVYALGIVLFEMLTGQKPFDGDSPIQIALKHVNENIPAPSTIKSDLPPEIDAFVLKATASNPDKRFKDAISMQDEFQAIAQRIDPKRRQLSLELDLPLHSEKAGARKKVKIKADKENRAMKEPTRTSNTTQIKRKASRRVKRNRLIALTIVLLIFLGLYQNLGGGAKIQVPSLAGMTTSQATKALSSFGLKSDTTDQVFSEDIPVGTVIRSNPAGGGKVAVHGVVHLQISKGPDRIKVPSLTGLTLDSATALLQSAGLKVGRTTQSFSPTLDLGLVISTNPAMDSPVRRDTAIDLVVSQGIQQIALTSYVGLPGDQALNELTSAGLIVSSTYQYSPSVPVGNVISQNPSGQGQLPKGSKVSIVISKGPSSVFIPNVYSLTQLKATTILENLGFKVKIHKIGKSKVATVTNVLPAVGKKAKPGSVVTITVG